MQFDIDEAKKFCRILVGGSDMPITWQVFYDPENEAKRPELAKNWTASFNDSLEFIKYKESQFCGIYLTVNETDHKGRSEQNITKIKYFVADYDNIEKPEWVIEPTFTTARDSRHGHAYWRVSDHCDIQEYKSIQMRIALRYGCDTQLTDLARVLRLAGSLHFKTKHNPKMYRVMTESDKSYTVAEFVAAHAMNATGEAELSKWNESRTANLSGDGYTDLPRYINQLIKYCQTQATPAIEGLGGNAMLLRSALYGKDIGISVEKCQEIFWEHYNPRCEPPWDDSIASKTNFYDAVENGYRYSGNAAGCNTAITKFSELTVLPEPIEGWQEHIVKEIGLPVATGKALDSHRITRNDGELLLSQCTIKSPHYDLVRAFDGMLFEGDKIIRSGGVFFEYDEFLNQWEEIGKDVIRAQIQRFFSEYKPNDTFTNGVFNVFKDFVNYKNVKNNMWLSDARRSCNDMALFNNGIVDFSNIDEVVIKPHTPDYFSLNNVGYDWDENMIAPNWIKFLNSVWDTPETNANILTLQEFMGYSLVSDMSLQSFLFLIGVSRSGKSIITKVMASIVGEANTCTPALNKLNSDSTIHHIIKSKLVLIPDAHSVAKNNRDPVLSQLKAITGEDDVSYHEMYVGSKTAIVQAKVVMTANSMPEFIDSSGALANRMIPIVFHKSFAGKEDRSLSKKLANETAAIAAWAIEGLRRLRRNNNVFTRSQDSIDELIEIREDMFPLAGFVKKCCKIRVDGEIAIDKIYATYQLYATLNGIKMPYTQIQFTKVMRSSELQLVKFRGVIDNERATGFRGIILNQEFKDKMGMGAFTAMPPLP